MNWKKINKNNLIIYCLLVFLLAVSVFIYNKTSKPEIYFEYDVHTVVKDESNKINIILNPKGNKVSAVTLDIKYDPDEISIDDVLPSSDMPVVLEKNLNQGHARVSLGIQPVEPMVKKGMLAEIYFALKPRIQIAKMTFTNDTKVAVIGKLSNFLGRTRSVRIVESQ